jgi:hypothetical protein
MGDLQPLGSEKLQGMDKIQRILEISRFRENTPSPINETSKSEYSLTLADGNEYRIVREKTGYIIKQTISESTVDYIAPIQERQYFKSYSQALRKLNLMAKDMNEMYGNEQGTSLFSEQKKFVLKTPEKKNTNPTDDVENVPAPAPMAPPPMASSPAPSPAGDEDMSMGDEEMPTNDMDMGDEEMPTDDMNISDEEGTTEPVGDNNDDAVTFKLIQKLTGKLGQKLRVLNSNEEDEMSSKDIKYVINSILSALDLENLDEEDKEDIMNKFEGIEADEEDDFGNEFEPSNEEEEEEGEEEGEEEKPIGFGEMGGTWDDLGQDIAMKTMMKAMTPGQFNEEEDDDNAHIGRIADSLFMEAKVEDVLMGYFNISEGEKKFNSKIGKTRLEQKKNQKSKRNLEIKRLSESLDQEIAARKFLNENKSASFVGKTNKKNLVFETNNKQIKVTPKGRII